MKRTLRIFAFGGNEVSPTGLKDAKGQAIVPDIAMPEFAKAKANGKKVAVRGVGPAGLGAAAVLAQRGYKVDVFEKRAKAAGMSTLPFNNAKIANRYWDDVKVGVLAEGCAADIVLIDYYPPTPMDASNFLGHLGFGLAQSFVDTTIVGGKVLMQNKKLKVNIDEEELAAKSLELSKALWERF